MKPETNFDKQSAIEILRKIRTVHIALCAGVILYLSLIIYLNEILKTPPQGDETLGQNLLIVALAMTAIGYFSSYTLFQKKLSQINSQKSSLKDKLFKYNGAFVMKIAFLEGPALFFIIIYQLTAMNLALYGTLLLFVIMLKNYPGIQKVATELNLSQQEISILKGKN